MNRRVFMSALTGGLFAAPLATEAQQPGKVPRIGSLGGNAAGNPRREAFLQGLRDLGYIEAATS